MDAEHEPAPNPSPNPVSEMRLVVTADDYETAVRFYRDVLGLPERAAYASPDGQVTILEAGRATLEIADPGRPRSSTGSKSAGGWPGTSGSPSRSPFRGDLTPLEPGGADIVAPATPTPWQTLNARLDGPAGLHLTLFSDGPGNPRRPATRPNPTRTTSTRRRSRTTPNRATGSAWQHGGDDRADDHDRERSDGDAGRDVDPMDPAGRDARAKTADDRRQDDPPGRRAEQHAEHDQRGVSGRPVPARRTRRTAHRRPGSSADSSWSGRGSTGTPRRSRLASW